MSRFVREMGVALHRLLSDKAAFATMLISIVLYMALYPQPYRSEVVRDVPIAVVDLDNSTSSRELTRRIDASESVRVAENSSGIPEAVDSFFARTVFGYVVIPPDFEQNLLVGEASPVAAYGDAGYFTLYSSMIGAVSAATRSLGADFEFSRLTGSGVDAGAAQVLGSPVANTQVALFNPQGGYASYVVPAAFVLILQQTLLMGIGLLHTGRRPAAGPALIAAPVAYILFYCLWVAVTQVALPVIYGLPWLGSWWKLYVLAVPFLMAVTAFGFAIAQLVSTREGVVFFLVVSGMPLFFLSGLAWPVESMPAALRIAAMLVPSTSAIPAFVRVDQMGADLAAVAPTIIWQLTLAAGYAVIALLLNWMRTVRTEPNRSVATRNKLADGCRELIDGGPGTCNTSGLNY